MLGNFTEWYVGRTFTGVSSYDFYTAWGDTLIDGKHYQFLNFYHFNNNFVIREEVDSGKVYMRIPPEPSQNFDHLIYDFSLEVGDSINVLNPAAPAPPSPGYYYVDSVKYQNLYADTRKVLYLSQRDERGDGYNFTLWIEGIGSGSLINTPGSAPDTTGIGFLKCYYKDQQAYYIDDTDTSFAPCQSYFTSLEEVSTVNELFIYPNPANNEIWLNIKKADGETVVGASVYDFSGRVVLEGIILSDSSNIIDISQLPSGIYLLKLHGSESFGTTFIKN